MQPVSGASGRKIACHIQQLGDVRDASFLAADAAADYAFLKGMHLPVLTAGLNQQMEEAVLAAGISRIPSAAYWSAW